MLNTVQTPEAISHEISKSFSLRPPKIVPVLVEAELSHVDEVKVNNHEENHVSDKAKSSSLKYSSQVLGYWILDNQEGKRQYNREFLIQLSKDPLSMKRPDSLPKLEIVLDHTPHRPFPIDVKSRTTLDFTPGYLKNPSKHKETPIKRKPTEICCVVPGEYVHFDAQLIIVKLRKLFKSEVPDEEIFDWIEVRI
ncbi:hypothetical protein Avbf_01738, partial [Armadillidium vulgare]